MEPSHPADGELLVRWRGGDSRAGEQLFRRHVAALTRFFQTKIDDEIDDLVQETFLDLVQGPSEVTSVRGLLFTIARRRLYDRFERRSRERLDFTERSAIDMGTSPSGQIAGQQDRVILVRALRTIPLEAQILLELAYWEELSGAELAQVLGIPANTVRSRLSRARAALEEAVERVTDDPSLRQVTRDSIDAWVARTRQMAPR